MERQCWIGVCLLVLLALLGVGCDEEKETQDGLGKESEDSREKELAAYEGRGTMICQEWQFTLCNYMEEQCGISTSERTACEKQYGAMACLSDETAGGCVDNILASKTCDPALLTSCDWDIIADLTPAVEGCNSFNTLFCETATECEFYESVESCMEEADANLPCENAVGLTQNYEACLAAFDDWACGEPTPAICAGVVIINQ